MRSIQAFREVNFGDNLLERGSGRSTEEPEDAETVRQAPEQGQLCTSAAPAPTADIVSQLPAGHVPSFNDVSIVWNSVKGSRR